MEEETKHEVLLPLPQDEGARKRGKDKRRKMRWLHRAKTATIVAGVIMLTLWAWLGVVTDWTGTGTGTGTGNVKKEHKDFQWSSITPTTDLIWHPCFAPPFRCARLAVPRDWTRPVYPHLPVALAVVSLPSSSPNHTYTSPLILNPGGPGGSGVAWLLENGPKVRRIAGKQHDLISFDPRGVNNTTPTTSCFPSEAARQLWAARAGSAIIGTHAEALGDAYARAKSLGAVCARENQGEWVGTPNVARDVVAITEAVWRTRGLSAVEAQNKGVRYWGLSYGTTLGMTLASMWPERVERMVLDAVVDVEDYYRGGWRRNLQDADRVVDTFFTSCAAAGAEKCTFAQQGDTAMDIEHRLFTLLEKLRTTPVPVYDASIAPDWITAADVHTLIFWSLYIPLPRFPLLSSALVALSHDDGAPAARILHSYFTTPLPSNDRNTSLEAGSAILCSDGYFGAHSMSNTSSLSEFEDLYQDLRSQSRWVAGNWASIQAACTGWQVPPRGLEWPGVIITHDPKKIETRHPVLFVSNALDPATPLANARRMRTKFLGAGLAVVVDGVGHGVGNVRSRCVEHVIGTYFDDGKVEKGEEEVGCMVDAAPFDNDVLVQMDEEEGWTARIPAWAR